jgi:hypothetical protein
MDPHHQRWPVDVVGHGNVEQEFVPAYLREN